jgi:hypothetical protein
MTVMEAKPFALAGSGLGLALGSWNLIAFWLNPLDDSVSGMVIVYTPMFVSWGMAGFLAARRTGRVRNALMAGTVVAFSTFVIFWIANIVRVNLFLDVLQESPGWQQTLMARYRESGFGSFRAFTNYEYFKDAPLKLAVPTAIGAILASLGGLVGMLGVDQARSRCWNGRSVASRMRPVLDNARGSGLCGDVRGSNLLPAPITCYRPWRPSNTILEVGTQGGIRRPSYSAFMVMSPHYRRVPF